MNRITALLIAAIALATGAYLWWDAERGIAVEEAADAVGEAAEGALEGTAEALTDTGQDDTGQEDTGQEDTAGERAEPTGPEGEAGVATEMQGGAAQGAEQAAEGALPETDPAAEAAVDALDPPVAEATGTALPEGVAPELLTADGFDAARVRALIAESDLGDLQKSTLTAALDAAAQGDAALPDVLDQIRAAFGL